MSKHKTPESQRVILAPPEWKPEATYHNCKQCRILQNLLDGANAKIERLQATLSNRKEQSPISPTARMAAIWAQQNKEIGRGEE